MIKTYAFLPGAARFWSSFLAGLAACFGCFLFWNVVPVTAAPPSNFAVEDVLTGLDQPMAIRFLPVPDGRMLLIQKKGLIRIVNVQGQPIESQVYMNLAAPLHLDGLDADQERGVLDIAVDPNFPADPYIYLFYTPTAGPNGPRSRVARFTHLENAGGVTSRGDLSSEMILWQDSEGYDSCCHMGGGLDFGPDGNLWVTPGEHFQGSYANDLQKSGGKVHRITKTGGIPAGNPYADGNGGNVDSIFAYGLRNPFRARWDLPSGRFFIGEVGGNTQSIAWEDLHVIRYDQPTGRFVDSDFGTGVDNGVYNGINFGWPTTEGLPPHTDYPGAIISDNVGEPFFAYKHSGAFAAITGGIVYHGIQFPTEFNGAYFYADSTRDFIRYLKFNPDGSLAANPSPAAIDYKNPDLVSYPFDPTPSGRIVALEVGPDGALYYVSFTDAGGAYGEPNPFILGAVRRYVYDDGNARPDVTQFSASPSSGISPLAVTFSIAATDPEGDPMTYVLDFGDGTAPTTSAPLPGNTTVTVSHTYLSDGPYQATLYVSDPLNTTTVLTDVTVGTRPVVSLLTSSNSRPGATSNMFRFGDTIHFSATATDAEDGSLTGASFSWSVSFIRPGNTHPAFGPQAGTTSVNFPIPNQGQGFSGPVYYRCFLTVTDSSGLTTTESIDIFPEKSNITFNTVPSGIVVQVDGNTAYAAPYVLDSLINVNHVVTVPLSVVISGRVYEFSHWANGPVTAQQTYNVPVADSSLTAYFVDLGPAVEPPVSGLVLHLHGGAGITENGVGLLAWNDQTANGNHLSAVGSPVVVDRAVNGLNAIHFDGTAAGLARTGFTGLPTGSADRSVFMVARYNAANATTQSWAGFTYGSAENNGAFGVTLTPAGDLGVQGWGGGNDISSNPPTNGVGRWLTQSAILNSGILNQYSDGTGIGSTSHGFNTGTGGIRLGEELNGDKNLDMDVAEVLIYNRAVSEIERQQIETYFEQRYAINAGQGNATPVVIISAPANNTAFTSAQMPVTLTATATDVEDGNLGASIAWSSSLDGPLGIGPAITATLSNGTHLLTAIASDSLLAPGSASVTVTVTPAGNGVLVTSGLVVHLESDLNVALQSGTTVAGWLDQSGEGNDMVASGSPQLGMVLTPTGQPSVSLDGASDKFERTGPLGGLPGGNADRTIFVLAKYNNSTAWAGVAYGAGQYNQAFGLNLVHPGGELVLQGWGFGNDLISTEPGIGAGWLVHSGMVTGGNGTLYKNGTQVAQFAHSYNTVLSKLVIGEEIAGYGYVGMDLAAVLIYDRALSEVERANVESYLRNKYLSAPASNTPPSVVISAPGNSSTHIFGAPVVFMALASDAQDSAVALTATISWTSNLSGVIGSGGSFATSGLALGTHTITAAVTDSGGLPGSTSISISVVPDTTPPVITVPGNLIVGANGASGAIVNFSTSALDNVNGVVATTNVPASGSLFPVGVTTVNVSATDGAGNVGNANFTVTVADTTAPVITLVGANPLVVSVGSPFTDPGATALDNVDGDLSTQIVVSGGPVATTAPGTYTLTYNVSDAALNAAVPVTRTVNVVDTTPPVLTLPANQIVEATSLAGATVSYPPATAVDNVTVAPDISYSQASGTVFPLGATTVTVTATDEAGNIDTETFTVTVVQVFAPELQFARLENPTNDTRVRFDSVQGVDYRLYTSTDMVQWDLLDSISGDGSQIEVIHEGGGADPSRFYRVGARLSGP